MLAIEAVGGRRSFANLTSPDSINVLMSLGRAELRTRVFIDGVVRLDFIRQIADALAGVWPRNSILVCAIHPGVSEQIPDEAGSSSSGLD